MKPEPIPALDEDVQALLVAWLLKVRDDYRASQLTPAPDPQLSPRP